jgi:acyl dehydratase
MASILDGLSVGDVVAEEEFSLSRDSLVRYAGASGDFNPIHYRDDVAQSVGLPGVLAHGMLTMGIAGSVVTDWCGRAYRACARDQPTKRARQTRRRGFRLG